MTGPLAGKRVLVTRPANQSEAFAAKLRAHGALPVVSPTIAVGPPDDFAPAQRAIDELRAFDWIAFTSRNGADAFFERLTALGRDAHYLGDVNVAAIGVKTAQRLEHFGVRAGLIPETHVGEEIARALIERTSAGDRVLIFGAQEARDVLPQTLENAGRSAYRVAAYKTTYVTSERFAERVAECDVVTFTSGSTVRGFVASLGGRQHAAAAAHGKTIACIGPIAASAVREAGLRVDVVAPVSTGDDLIEALAAHFASRA